MERHVQEISEELVKNGFVVEVICTDPTGRLNKNEVINGVKVTRLNSIAPGDAYYFSPQIYFYLKELDCDVIHAHNYHSFTSLFAALAKKNRRFYFTPHTFGFTKIFPRNIFHMLYKPFGAFIFYSADKIISISRIEQEWLKKTFQIAEEKLFYIPLPIDTGLARTRKERKKRVKIIFIGRLSEEKNVDVLISAFEIVKHRRPECELYIIGDGPLREYMENLSKDIKDIYFLGRQTHDNVLKFLDDADIFVLPSKFEVSPISILEAMVRSVPVITTPVGELPHVLEDGKTCLFTKINDVNDLAMRILVLVEDKFFAKRIAESGRDFVKEKHDINKIIDSYVKLYTQ
ncbi:MAG: glycosyltransferase family 4 protein [Candidatus Methanoperedens sp.]|nr:glycosyltransferase family 4 protein [Candidatus Methanoperedens sp.]